MWGVRFDRKLFARLVRVFLELILLLGLIWIVVSFALDKKSLSDGLANVFIWFATLATVATLFSLLTLWPDPVGDARKDINTLRRKYIELRDSKAPSYSYTHVVQNIRALAALAKYSSADIKAYLEMHEESYEIAWLSIVQYDWYDNIAKYEKPNEIPKEYFEGIKEILTKPKSPYEHYLAIWTMDGIGNNDRKRTMTIEEQNKGMIFHLKSEQQKELCEALKAYDKNRINESGEWGRFFTLVKAQVWCSPNNTIAAN